MLNHQGTIEIETERLILRRFTANDAKDMYRNWASDREVCRYMRWAQHESVEETMAVINGWLNSYDKTSFYQWAITLKNINKLIGAVGLFIVNESDLCGDVGYCISKNYWGQDFATEALKSVLDYAFMIVGFNRIETYHAVNNPASGRVMQKSGMMFEGHARQKYRSNLGFEDSDMYAILKQDYKNYNQITD
ncbi:GNAT family N-acetyltransferase [Anaerosolibacter sp.]|uniref:GNAT family N-acetyltransferase n=1 Tax=Anaerosolibacter sp. TaxID=1872527 RepID=UPI0039F0866A